jgi:hypothetical protein
MIKIAPQLSWPPVDGEVAVYDSRDGKHHVFNSSAARIWHRIAEGLGAVEIASELAAEHRAPVESVRRDVDLFIAEGLELGLLINA